MTDTEDTARAIPYGIPAPGRRLPAATRLGPVRLQIGDLDRSLAYYGGALGLRVLERGASRAVLGTEDRVALVELRERAGAEAVARRARLGLYHFAILLPTRPALGAFLGHLRERGEPFAASDHLVSEALYLHDPDGLGIEVYADRPREAWRAADGQLVMATEPLDVASLTRAAEGVAWRGAPEGTTMGHVHLHVGDLERAEAFYHATLGLDKTVWSYPGALFLSAGGYHHHLGLNTWAAGAPPAGEGDAKLLDWELVLPSQADLEGVRESLEAAGTPVRADGSALMTRDPWGTEVRIRAPG